MVLLWLNGPKAPGWERRYKVAGSIPGYDSNFQLRIAKNINKSPSVNVIVVLSQ